MLANVGLNGRNYKIARLYSTHDATTVYQAYDQHGRARTVSLSPYAVGAGGPGSEQLAERIGLAAALEYVPQFARFEDAGVVMPNEQSIELVLWVEDAVWGNSLSSMLSHDGPTITISRLKRLATDLGIALSALRKLSAVHGNIGAETVTLQEPDPLSSNNESFFRLSELHQLRKIDFEAEPDSTDDQAILDLLVQCHNHLIRTRLASASAKAFLQRLSDILIELSADVQTGKLIDGAILSQMVNDCDRTSEVEVRAPTLRNPFDYISAEHFADDELLVDIFADSCPWLEDVAKPNPNLIVGPRGCGKSTLLRWLSIKAHLSDDDQHFEKYGLAAFFISCTGEIQTRLGHIQDIEIARLQRDAIIHYFNMMVAFEVVETLVAMVSRPEAQRTVWGLTHEAQGRIHRYFAGQLSADSALLAGISPLKQTMDLIEDELQQAKLAITNKLDLLDPTGEAFLTDLSRMLTREVPFFQNNQIVFCVDDYSVHRVPDAVQQVLNRVVFGVRSSTHIFKISAEKYGFVSRDEYGARIDMQRELVLVDCGEEFILLGDGPRQARAHQFARDLLANRLRKAGYVGTPEQLIGPTSRSNLSQAIKLRARATGGQIDDSVDLRYSGLDCIADLCSGDVATLLLVYRRIFDEAAVSPEQTAEISRDIQHQSIRFVSRQMLNTIRSHHPHGPRMLAIVEQFGTLVRYALERGPLVSSHGKSRPAEPMQYPRIELNGVASIDALPLPDELTELARELIRRSVFIELTPGNARQSYSNDSRKSVKINTVSERLQIRRIYLPSFGVSLGKNGAWKWSPKEFENFLSDPVLFCSAKRAELRNNATAGNSVQIALDEIEG